MKYTFVIPVKEINGYIRESIPKILEIHRDDFEIIIYPDVANEEKWEKTRQIATGPGGPAMKRGLASRDAQGEILIFIDDDAYPGKNILDILDKNFQDESVAAIGGPAITPKNDSFSQKVSGAFFLSSLSGGFPERYIPIGKKRFVIDWPSVNLSVRKSAFLKIGGFDSQYWPGEDTKFCLDIMHKLKERNKILYDPEVIVWHHRREGFLHHLKQVGSYGLHRGFFAKKFPETSRRFKYFVPSAFFIFSLLSVIILALFIFQKNILNIIYDVFILGWIIYFLALLKAFFEIKRHEKFFVSLVAIFYTIFTHIWYGLRFIQGFLFTRELRSKLR